MPTIVISELIDRDALLRLAVEHEARQADDLVDRPVDLVPALADAHVLIMHNRTRVDATLLAAAPHLEAVGRFGWRAGQYRSAACRDRDVTVYMATGGRSNHSHQ